MGIITEENLEDEFSKSKISAGNFFEIKKHTSPEKYNEYISNISIIYKKAPKLLLSYWTFVGDLGENGKNEECFESFYKNFNNLEINDITITWNDYSDYYNANKWIVYSKKIVLDKSMI